MAVMALFSTQEVRGDMQIFPSFNLNQDMLSALKMLNLYQAPVVEANPTLEIDLNDLENGVGAYEAAGDSQIVIRADENPTTGYRWAADSQNCGVRVKQVSDEFVLPDDAMIGTGGQRVWTFQTPKPEENYIRGLPCDIKFSHRRSWEHGNTAEKTIRITVN